MSEFQDIEVIVSQSELEKHKKELLLLDNREVAEKELVTVLRETLVAVF